MINDTNECFVELMMINTKSLLVTYIANERIIDSKIMKGRLKDGYFELRHNVFIVPAIFVNVCRTIKFRIGLLANGNLTADYREVVFGTGFIIIPVFDDIKTMDCVYKKHKRLTD